MDKLTRKELIISNEYIDENVGQILYQHGQTRALRKKLVEWFKKYRDELLKIDSNG